MARHFRDHPPKYEKIIEFGDLAAEFLKVAKDGIDSLHWNKSENRMFMSDQWSHWRKRNEWQGNCSAEDVVKWLHDGFKKLGEAVEDHSYVPYRKRRKFVFSDFEGDYQYDLDESGFDNYFMDQTKSERVPGVSMNIAFNFSNGTSGETVVAYGEWAIKTLMNLEASGVDSEVNIFCALDELFKEDVGARCVYRIRLKRENEAQDLANWSAMFSPGGYRILCFFGWIRWADELNMTASHWLGVPPRQNDFDVEVDKVTRRADIYCPTCEHGGVSFKKDEMTAKFIEGFELKSWDH